MTSIAGVVAVVVVLVACIALGIVIPIEEEVFIVIEFGGGPAFYFMAKRTVIFKFQMQGVTRIAVAPVALFLQTGFE